MDSIQDVAPFQGVIISADNVHTFSKLTSRGGNEEKVKDVLDKIRYFLQEKNYINENGLVAERIDEARKLALYIVLNADLPVLEHISELEGLDMVIWMLPNITKYLMTEIFWNLHLDNFLYEIVAFCNPNLSLEVIDAFITNMKYLNPVNDLNKIRTVSAACYRLICRMHFYVDSDTSIRTKLLTTAINYFKASLNNLTNPPNPDKVLSLRKDDQYKYLGRSLSIMLLLIEECFKQFTNKQEFSVGNNEIYESTFPVEHIGNKTFDCKICDTPNQAILEALNKCNTFLLDDCTTQVMSVSVDIFCAWSEYEENGKSMQQSIGELCFKLRSILLNISSVADHPLVGMLKQISREPIDHKDVINDIEVDVIVEKINAKNDESKAWVCALPYKNDLFQNVTLLQLLDSNLEMLDEELNHMLFEKICSNLKDNPNADQLKLLNIKVFQRCSISVKEEIISKQFNESLHDEMEAGNFIDFLTEVFNKLTVSSHPDPSDVLTVFLQNPKQVYTKIFKLAAENSKQTDIMLKTMNCIEKYTNHFYSQDAECCMVKVTHEIFESIDTETKQINLVNFISSLKNRNIITGNKLLIMIVMPNLHKGLVNKNIMWIQAQIRLLRVAFTIDEMLPYRAPMLAMLAQVLDVVRWKFTTYQPTMPPTLELTLRLQVKLFKTYGPTIPVKELIWLKGKLKNMQPLNMYYYRRLWDPPGESFVEVITGLPIDPDVDPEEITPLLLQVLCLLTQSEWKDVYEKLSFYGEDSLLDVLQDAIILITVAEASNHTEATWACLMNCYRNFVMIIRTKYLKEPLEDHPAMNVICKIICIINAIEDRHVLEMGTLLLPLLSYMAENSGTLTINLAHYLRERIKKPQFSVFINQVFGGPS